MEQVEQIVIEENTNEENCVYAMVNPAYQFNGYWLVKIGQTQELNKREIIYIKAIQEYQDLLKP